MQQTLKKLVSNFLLNFLYFKGTNTAWCSRAFFAFEYKQMKTDFLFLPIFSTFFSRQGLTKPFAMHDISNAKTPCVDLHNNFIFVASPLFCNSKNPVIRTNAGITNSFTYCENNFRYAQVQGNSSLYLTI